MIYLNKNFMEKGIMLETRTWILQTKLLCAKACKINKTEDKKLRKTDGTGQYANFVLMSNNSVVILTPILIPRGRDPFGQNQES